MVSFIRRVYELLWKEQVKTAETKILLIVHDECSDD